MGTLQDKEVAQSLLELLAIAKTCIPDLLCGIEARIQRVQKLAVRRCQLSGSRSTYALAELSDELPIRNVKPSATARDLEQMRECEPATWDITAGLDAFTESNFAPESRTEGTIFILRDWLIGHGYIEAPPEPEEAH